MGSCYFAVRFSWIKPLVLPGVDRNTSSNKTLSKKITGLKKGKTYYVKVRAYKTFGGKTKYGQWSKYKSIKCK